MASAPVLIVDNLSPFTKDIVDCLRRIDGIEYQYRKFNDVSAIDLENCGRVILSGRRKNSRENNVVNSSIIKQCYFKRRIPLLGICYGAEIIALTLGGTIVKMPSHLQWTFEILSVKQNLLTGDRRSIMAYESHGYCISTLPENFETLASSHYCKHEIFSSKNGRIYGTQFHPEKSGSDGSAILKNFVNI
jgi:GMP synthase (glutamine-hydrolysing)